MSVQKYTADFFGTDGEPFSIECIHGNEMYQNSVFYFRDSKGYMLAQVSLPNAIGDALLDILDALAVSPSEADADNE